MIGRTRRVPGGDSGGGRTPAWSCRSPGRPSRASPGAAPVRGASAACVAA